MAEFPDTGKIQNSFFKELVFPFCGAKRHEVIVGPEYGVDVAVVNLSNGLGMALTSDPLSLVPTLGLKESAWLSVQLMANDMATTGFAPMYAQLALNLPPSLSVGDFDVYWKYIHEFCSNLGTSITGGHTGRFEGQNSTVVGGGTMITIAPVEDILTSKGARPGDIIIMTKECALVATSILAMSFPEMVKQKCGSDVQTQGSELFYQTSAVSAGVEAGLFKKKLGGVTAMHDVTEGGVLGALYELAHASRCGVEINQSAIPVGTPQQKIAELFEIDPYYTIGAGAMIITVKSDQAQLLINHLSSKNIPAAIIGQVTDVAKGLTVMSDHQSKPLEHPGADPYWNAFFSALKKGWK